MATKTEDAISKRQIRAALKNAQLSAEVVNLSYINDSIPGITRKRKGERFIYYHEGQVVKDTETLIRIKSLAIPPAWEGVWISPIPDSHLQATGIDAANRKQYRYHPLWNKIRSHTKYYRMLDFGLSLPDIREKIEADLNLTGMPREKILAAIITILDSAYIRIGNSIYEKINGSYGLTTLKNKHAKIDGYSIKFQFTGKKGIKSNVTIRSRKLVNIIRKCKEIRGQQLFAYINGDGTIKRVDSGMVNEYIREKSGNEFTAKDFRTWAGSVGAIKAFNELGGFASQSEMKTKINQMYDMVASNLGNTRNVCRTHYVNPFIIKLYEAGKLLPMIKKASQAGSDASDNLKPEEVILLSILKK
jgi:DNA topoisomerase I